MMFKLLIILDTFVCLYIGWEIVVCTLALILFFEELCGCEKDE